jgi:hypothetical protein
MHDVDRAVFRLASQQHGAFARWQVLAHGGHDELIRRRCREGFWIAVRPGVYVLAGLPPDPDRELWIAWLAVGPHAVVSHETAGERQVLRPVIAGRLVFTTKHGDHHRLRGVVVHQLRDLLPHHVHVVDGLPCTTVARTIVDLAAVSQIGRLRLVVENGVNDGLVTDEQIGIVLAEVARKGKWGMAKTATVLAERAPGDPLPTSVLERMLLDAVLGAGNPQPVPQLAHPGRHPTKGCVDFAYPAERMILEADGRRWHQRIADLKRDRARDNEAARAGWLTMRFMWEELRNDPADVGRAVRETRAHRLAA